MSLDPLTVPPSGAIAQSIEINADIASSFPVPCIGMPSPRRDPFRSFFVAPALSRTRLVPDRAPPGADSGRSVADVPLAELAAAVIASRAQLIEGGPA